tara:strand:+ start:1284 stop:1739 length:456 start_codon:yes stop_codon:yes gene_type:complete
MRRINVEDLKDVRLLQHYRIIRKWASKTCDIKEADLELLMYLDGIEFFSKQDFKTGSYSYSWDNRRWNRLLKNDWIIVWRKRNRTTQKYHIYKTSRKFKHLLNRIYKIILGEEEIPTSEKQNSIMKGEGYMNKVLSKSIRNINADKRRGNG